MTSGRIRVLVVDDSAFARKVIRDVLRAQPLIEVVGVAVDGLDALEKIERFRPDVLTLDLHMPGLDGLGVLQALPPDGPRAVIVSTAPSDHQLALAAIDAGAVDIVRKPTPHASDDLYGLSDHLVRAVLAASIAQRRPAPLSPPAAPAASPVPTTVRTDAVVIGASTGGPQAVSHVVAALPRGLPVAVAVVIHIPPGYTEALAERINRISALDVIEAVDGMTFAPGRVAIAQAGMHLKVRRTGHELRLHFDTEPRGTLHRPSVDVLFTSAAAACGDRVLGVVLTGMGSDGTEGARAIRVAGGRVLAEDASSCVVYGMPRSIAEAGLADAIVPLDRMAACIVRQL